MILDMTFENREHMIRRDSREEGRAEGRAEGREEGRAEGRLEALLNAIEGGLDKNTIITVLKYTEEEYNQALAK